jgi:diacylglycerol kinase
MENNSTNSTWIGKFKNAIRGIGVGVRGERTNSFYVHIPMAIATILAGLFLGVSKLELVILVLCVGIVISAELFNCSLEQLARSITKESDENVRNALDIASGAVLIASLMAAIVGVAVLVSAAVNT